MLGQKVWKDYRNRTQDGREQHQTTHVEAAGAYYYWRGRPRQCGRMMMHVVQLARASASAVRSNKPQRSGKFNVA